MLLRCRAALAWTLVVGCGAQPPQSPAVEVPTEQRAAAPAQSEVERAPAPEEVTDDAGPQVDGGDGAVVAATPVDDDDPFPDRTHVTVTELVDALDRVAQELESAPAVIRDYEAFLAAHDLADAPALFRDYVRVKLAFEATRDGGWWHLRWKVTNEQPNSERIWAQWGDAEVPRSDDPQRPTAVAECDELSALFAFVARRLGVKKVGLFWPVWNHVVAVWTIEDRVRVVVPTSQIFLGADESLGTDGFDPWKQKTIYTYTRRDVKPQHRIPAPLARFFVQQARTLGSLPQSEQQERRNARAAALGGS